MPNNPNTQNVAQEILRTVDDLKHGTGFGSVEIIAHEGRVTQIEKREKQCFTHHQLDLQKDKTATTLNTINGEATKK
ncbi:MAG: hypothetical protein A3I83_09165 [Methylotenera sp. RIFCSPLOWO2_02_FULL_45_14]|nr:MAG: hypothetical protein A3I83_09165 [Methylotenera sp. RIFCSPLOWO2_02_FULL_45_14]